MILLLSVGLWIGCDGRPEYLDSSERIFMLPRGSVVTAPEGKFIITDGGGEERIELRTVTIPYQGVIVSDGMILKLYKLRRTGGTE